MLESTAQREPDSELFDACCDLAAATHRLKFAAAHPEVVPGLAATLGCLDKSLQQLAEGLEPLESLAAVASGRSGAVADGSPRDRPVLGRGSGGHLRCDARLEAAPRSPRPSHGLIVTAELRSFTHRQPVPER